MSAHKSKVVAAGHNWGQVLAAIEDGKVKETSLASLDGDDLKGYLDAKLSSGPSLSMS
jgi:hypothetical protein